MASYTAQFLIGSSHPNHGGIILFDRIYLSENGRPVFILEIDKGNKEEKWIPTIEGALEDALLMIGVYLLKDEVLVKEVSNYIPLNQQEMVELYEIEDKNLKDLYSLNRTVFKKYGLKIVLTILDGSLLRGQITVLKNYQVDMEVCLPVYSRVYSEWRGEVIESGDLDIS